MITRDSWRGEAAVVVIISSHYRRHSGVTATTQHLAPAPTARAGEKYAVTRTFLANHNKPGLSLPCVH